MWYKTIQGYRTGVLNLKSRIDRQENPLMYSLGMVLDMLLSLVGLAAVALLIYSQTHPEWRIQH
jgi:hypothetical protein